jgi:hypothetical protein
VWSDHFLCGVCLHVWNLPSGREHPIRHITSLEESNRRAQDRVASSRHALAAQEARQLQTV